MVCFGIFLSTKGTSSLGHKMISRTIEEVCRTKLRVIILAPLRKVRNRSPLALRPKSRHICSYLVSWGSCDGCRIFGS
jgi:hypothetical protein